ncbi:MAG: hypothetical protein IJG40_01170 [Oscillospiraceae bacterium]|nr:hypothetical protein [Oscillospiraceae bacterium]
MIITSHIDNSLGKSYVIDEASQIDTDDRIFLLSYAEAKKYFQSDDERICIPTKYVKEHGAYTKKSTGACAWWLRTSIDYGSFGTAMAVTVDGVIDSSCYGDINSNVRTVRPALWINIE